MEATRTLFSLDSLYGEDLEIENPIGTIISDRDTWEVHKDGLGFRTKFYKILGYHIEWNGRKFQRKDFRKKQTKMEFPEMNL